MRCLIRCIFCYVVQQPPLPPLLKIMSEFWDASFLTNLHGCTYTSEPYCNELGPQVALRAFEPCMNPVYGLLQLSRGPRLSHKIKSLRPLLLPSSRRSPASSIPCRSRGPAIFRRLRSVLRQYGRKYVSCMTSYMSIHSLL